MPPNAEMVSLHNRMPLVVEHADWPAWLSEAESDPVKLYARHQTGHAVRGRSVGP